MKNRICEMLGIEFPILAFTHCRDVAAAVTKAGGFGVLGAEASTPDQFDVDLAWIAEQVGGKPFGVDVIIPAKYEGKAEGEVTVSELRARIPQQHRDFVEHLLEEFHVPPPIDDDRSGRLRREAPPMSRSSAEQMMEIAFSHPIRLIVNALGSPPPDMVTRAHGQGILVGALAGKAVHAQRHVAAGVDLVIAQGGEAGGHTGEIGTMVLVPEVVDAVAPVPVLAAGGIGGGRQMAAALALGAEGVWCGSVWLTTDEAETHPLVKEKFLAASSSDTIRSRSRTGKPARQLKSAWTEAWDAPDSPGTLPMPLQPLLVDGAIARIDRGAHDPKSGAAQLANYFVGQIVGSMNETKPAARVVLDMVEEFIDAVQRVESMMQD
jgi:NAD(P)H-dependent flavin oxidoreductase YrpB (nitropropane dioxygenase family)